jgi:hypothetical protein
MIFVAAVIIGGTLLYRLKIRHQTGVLAEHAAAVAAHPSSGAAQHEAAQYEAPEDAVAAKMAASEA